MSAGQMVRHFNLVNVVIFSTTTLLSVIGLPWYIKHVGISAAEWWLFGFYVLATGMSITVGYHRLFAHRAFQAHPVIKWLALWFGAAALEQSALLWASQHRDHHRYVDTDLDPYNIKKGFWYAHIGWMLFWQHKTNCSNVRDLSADPVIRHQHRYYLAWALAAGVAMPLIIGAATGHLLGAFLLSVAARITFVHHSTFSINSICHTFGRATYDIDSTARDHWIVAILTNGEGYHNFHHRFPSDYRNGIRWYQWDPSKWFIVAMNLFGMARHLYRTPPHSILAAKLAAEELRIERALATQDEKVRVSVLAQLQNYYAGLKDALYNWEHGDKEYQKAKSAIAEQLETPITCLRQRMEAQRIEFLAAKRHWIDFINSHPLISKTARVGGI